MPNPVLDKGTAQTVHLTWTCRRPVPTRSRIRRRQPPRFIPVAPLPLFDRINWLVDAQEASVCIDAKCARLDIAAHAQHAVRPTVVSPAAKSDCRPER